MDEQLLPCPFCGGEAEFRIHDNGLCDIVCKSCPACVRYAKVDEYEFTVGAWNTRHERTCENMERGMFWCSECGFSLETYNDYGGFSNLTNGTINYCPNCGAKVVD